MAHRRFDPDASDHRPAERSRDFAEGQVMQWMDLHPIAIRRAGITIKIGLLAPLVDTAPVPSTEAIPTYAPMLVVEIQSEAPIDDRGRTPCVKATTNTIFRRPRLGTPIARSGGGPPEPLASNPSAGPGANHLV
jgi:hypothetical protein